MINSGTCLFWSSDRGINSPLGRFMPRKHLHHTQKNSLGTGCGKRFTFRAPSPRRQEWDNKGKALGFDLSAWNARGLGIVTRKGQDKTASPFWLGSLANRARKAPAEQQVTLTQSFD